MADGIVFLPGDGPSSGISVPLTAGTLQARRLMARYWGEFCRQLEGSRTLLFFCILTVGGLGIGGSGLLHWWRIAMSLVALAVGTFGLLGVVGWFVRLGELERERAARRRR
uniref:Integral membrane protein n=1 Tax=Streptomyces sp. NBC_00003 TaxID=2903608 RepID=A0AAU2V1J2_9ACTN